MSSQMDYHSRIEELRESARELPWGYARTALIEEAAHMADGCQDVALGYEIRMELIDAARYSLRYDLFATTFAWCFGVEKQQPGRFSVRKLLEYYQYVIGNLANFSHVSKEQFLALHADAAQHYIAQGFSLRTLTVERSSAAIDYADQEMAETAYHEISRHDRDELSMPREMETVRALEHFVYLGDDARVAKLLDDHFDDDTRNRWADQWLSNIAFRSLYRVGRKAQAESIHERNHNHFESGGGYGWSWGNHLSYCAVTGRLARGLTMLRQQLPVAMSHADTLTQFYCLSHAVVLLDELVETGETRIHLPPVPKAPWLDHECPLDVVRDWFVNTVASICTEFDTRNGNTFYADLAARRRAERVV